MHQRLSGSPCWTLMPSLAAGVRHPNLVNVRMKACPVHRPSGLSANCLPDEHMSTWAPNVGGSNLHLGAGCQNQCTLKRPLQWPKKLSHLFFASPFFGENFKTWSLPSLVYSVVPLWKLGTNAQQNLVLEGHSHIEHQPQHLGYTPAFKSPTSPDQLLGVRLKERTVNLLFLCDFEMYPRELKISISAWLLCNQHSWRQSEP